MLSPLGFCTLLARVRALFLTLATFPHFWIRPSKHGNHKVIVQSADPVCSYQPRLFLTVIQYYNAIRRQPGLSVVYYSYSILQNNETSQLPAGVI